MFTFSGAIVESGDAGGMIPARNRVVTFVDAVTGGPVTFADGTTKVTTDNHGRFSGLQHATYSQIKPVVNGYISEDIINAAFDVAATSQASIVAAAAAEAAAASAKTAATDAATQATAAAKAQVDASASAAAAAATSAQNAANNIAAAAGAAAGPAVDNALNVSPRIPQFIDVGTGVLVRIDAADGTSTWLQANDSDGGPTAWAKSLLQSSLGVPSAGAMATNDPRVPQTIDTADGVLVRIDASDGMATWLQASDSDGGPTAWAVSLLKSSLNIPPAGIMATNDNRIPQVVDTADDALVRIDAADGTATWLQANATDGGPTAWALSMLQAAITTGSAYGYNLLAAGLKDATTDIGALINSTFGQGFRHVIVPYRAAAWPSLTTFTVPADCKLEFEPGARIANNMAAQSGSIVYGTLVNPSFTSTAYSVPSSAAHASAPDYAYPSRETLFKDGARVVGNYFHEYAATGVHITGKDVIFFGSIRCRNMRQRTGWGQVFHIDGDGASQIYVMGRIYSEDSDRGIEVEDGARDVHILGGGYAKNVYPNGYPGQPSDTSVGDHAVYAGYTFVYDLGHAHDFSGGGGDGLTHAGPQRIIYQGGFVAENCGSPILTCQRSIGTAAVSIPRDSSMDELHIIGRSVTAGSDIELGGVNNHIGRVVFSEGAGIAGGSFKIKELPTGSGNFIGRIQGTSGALATLTITSSGAGLTKMQTVALTAP